MSPKIQKKKETKAQPAGRLQRADSWLEGRRIWILAAGLALYVVFAALAFDPKPFVGGDNAAYVILSKSLVAGKGLSDIGSPAAGPNTLYPFGFPLLLSPVTLLRLGYAWYKAVPFLAGLLGLWLAWSVFKDLPAKLALLIVLLMAVNPSFVEYSHWVLSEMPFLAFSLLAIYFLQRWEAKRHPADLAGLVLSAVFTNYIRSAGLALFAGVFLHLLIRKDYKTAGIFIAACIALSLPWTLRNRHYGASASYVDWFLVRDPYQLELGRMTLGEMAGRFWENVKLYLGQIAPRMLFPMADGWGLGRSGLLLFIAIVAPAMAGLAARLRRGASGYDWYFICYMGISLLWPTAWADIRFILPVLPFLLFYLISGYGLLFGLLFGRAATGPALVLSVLLLTLTVWPSAAGWQGNLEMLSAYRRGDRLAGYDPAWRSFFSAAAWVRDSTPAPAIVVSRKPTLFYLASGRPAYSYPFTSDRDSVLRSVRRADYVMVEPVSGTLQKYLLPAITPVLDSAFTVVHNASDPPTYVLKVIKEKH